MHVEIVVVSGSEICRVSCDWKFGGEVSGSEICRVSSSGNCHHQWKEKLLSSLEVEIVVVTVSKRESGCCRCHFEWK